MKEWMDAGYRELLTGQTEAEIPQEESFSAMVLREQAVREVSPYQHSIETPSMTELQFERLRELSASRAYVPPSPYQHSIETPSMTELEADAEANRLWWAYRRPGWRFTRREENDSSEEENEEEEATDPTTENQNDSSEEGDEPIRFVNDPNDRSEEEEEATDSTNPLTGQPDPTAPGFEEVMTGQPDPTNVPGGAGEALETEAGSSGWMVSPVEAGEALDAFFFF